MPSIAKTVLGLAAIDHKSCRTLVDDLDELGVCDEFGLGRDGELADLEELLTVKEHARIEVGDNVVEVEGGFGVERMDAGKSDEVRAALYVSIWGFDVFWQNLARPRTWAPQPPRLFR